MHNHVLSFPQDLHLIQGTGGIKRKGQNSNDKDHHEFSTSVLMGKQDCFFNSFFLYNYAFFPREHGGLFKVCANI